VRREIEIGGKKGRLSLAPGFSRVNPAIMGNETRFNGFPCIPKPLKRLPDVFRPSSPG
jgi:hypothetical protein